MALYNNSSNIGKGPKVLRARNSAERWASWRSFDTGRATYLKPRPFINGHWRSGPSLPGRLHPEVADLQFGLALVSADSSKYDEAIDHCEAGLDVLDTAYGPDHRLVARGLRDLAFYQFLSADLGSSLKTAIQAEATSRRNMVGVARHLAEREALRYADVKPPALDLALSIVAQGAAADDIEEVWDAVIRSRAVVLDEMAARQRAAFAADNPRVAESYRALVSARHRLAHLIVAGPDGGSGTWKSLVDDARRESERFERLLSARSLAFRREQELPRVGLQDVLGSLPSNASLVAYVRYNDLTPQGTVDSAGRTGAGVPSYMAFEADSTGSVVALPVGPASEIDKLVGDLRRITHEAMSAGGRRIGRAEASFRTSAGLLRVRIWDPVAHHIAGSDVILVVPDGRLNLVSFASFPQGDSDYLIENGIRIHYLSAERDVVAGGRPVSAEKVARSGLPRSTTIAPSHLSPASSGRNRRRISPGSPAARYTVVSNLPVEPFGRHASHPCSRRRVKSMTLSGSGAPQSFPDPASARAGQPATPARVFCDSRAARRASPRSRLWRRGTTFCILPLTGFSSVESASDPVA